MPLRNSRRPAALAAILALALLISAPGCDNGQQASVTPVSGRVLLDGEPLKFGTVTFQPTRGQPARGEIGPEGEFILATYRPADGAAVGRHKVKITCYTSQDPAARKLDGLPPESLGESLIPDRYTRFDTSGLEVAVLAGGNKPFEFDLESDADDADEGTPAEDDAVLIDDETASRKDESPRAAPHDDAEAASPESLQ